MGGSRVAAPKGTFQCPVEHRGTYVCPSVHPSISPSICLPQALSGLKSALSGLKSTLSALRADTRPERADSRLERADFRPKRVDFRPGRADFRPIKADFVRKRTRGDGLTDGQTDGRMNGQLDEQKSPCIYRTLSPLGPLPKKLKNAEQAKVAKALDGQRYPRPA